MSIWLAAWQASSKSDPPKDTLFLNLSGGDSASSFWDALQTFYAFGNSTFGYSFNGQLLSFGLVLVAGMTAYRIVSSRHLHVLAGSLKRVSISMIVFGIGQMMYVIGMLSLLQSIVDSDGSRAENTTRYGSVLSAIIISASMICAAAGVYMLARKYGQQARAKASDLSADEAENA